VGARSSEKPSSCSEDGEYGTYKTVKATYKTVKATYKTVKATYKTVKATCKTVKAIYKTVKSTYKTVKAIYKTVKAIYKTVKARPCGRRGWGRDRARSRLRAAPPRLRSARTGTPTAHARPFEPQSFLNLSHF